MNNYTDNKPDDRVSLSVVIPAYNEEDGIGVVIEELKGILDSALTDRAIGGYEIIVVDDCSSDDTFGKVTRCREYFSGEKSVFKVIRHSANKGYGAAIMSGIEVSTNDLIVTIDGDGSYSAADIIKLLPSIRDFDLVVGLRTGREYRGTFIKYLARICFRWLAEYISGEKIPDINSGLRIFSKKVFLSMPSVHICRGFSFSTTMTLMYLAGGLNVRFEPIEYRARRGVTKVRYIRDVLRALQILLEIAIYYNPIKAILPFALLPFLGGLALMITGLIGVLSSGSAMLCWVGAAVCFCFSILIFAIGMVITQIRMVSSSSLR